jgi:hypothetical protein
MVSHSYIYIDRCAVTVVYSFAQYTAAAAGSLAASYAECCVVHCCALDYCTKTTNATAMIFIPACADFQDEEFCTFRFFFRFRWHSLGRPKYMVPRSQIADNHHAINAFYMGEMSWKFATSKWCRFVSFQFLADIVHIKFRDFWAAYEYVKFIFRIQNL